MPLGTRARGRSRRFHTCPWQRGRLGEGPGQSQDRPMHEVLPGPGASVMLSLSSSRAPRTQEHARETDSRKSLRKAGGRGPQGRFWDPRREHLSG